RRPGGHRPARGRRRPQHPELRPDHGVGARRRRGSQGRPRRRAADPQLLPAAHRSPGRHRMTSPSYPVNLVVEGRPVLVVGGGRVATGKVRRLVESGAVVAVVAPEVRDEIAAIPGVAVERRPYEPGEVAGYRLAVTATGTEVDAQ